jgi:hypothetical protein
VARLVVGSLEVVQWGLALAMFVAGAVMWHDRRWRRAARTLQG